MTTRAKIAGFDSFTFTFVVGPMSASKPRRPHGRWTYYIMHEDILWPCPVRWEWENGYGGWLPFYYSPTLEFVAGDPTKATKVAPGRAAVPNRYKQLAFFATQHR